MAKTATVQARLDCDLKENAELILAQVGLTSSDAINLFYKQIELNGGLPFEVKVPPRILAERRLLSELEEGERSAKEGGWLTVDESKKKLGI